MIFNMNNFNLYILLSVSYFILVENFVFMWFLHGEYVVLNRTLVNRVGRNNQYMISKVVMGSSYTFLVPLTVWH